MREFSYGRNMGEGAEQGNNPLKTLKAREMQRVFTEEQLGPKDYGPQVVRTTKSVEQPDNPGRRELLKKGLEGAVALVATTAVVGTAVAATTTPDQRAGFFKNLFRAVKKAFLKPEPGTVMSNSAREDVHQRPLNTNSQVFDSPKQTGPVIPSNAQYLGDSSEK